MQVRRVGDSGLVVSRLGLGTLTWGRDTDEEHARGLLEAFCEAGGTLIDTAAAYGAGDAERLVGRLVDEVSHRDDVVIASKAGFVVRRGERVVDTSRRGPLRRPPAAPHPPRAGPLGPWAGGRGGGGPPG